MKRHFRVSKPIAIKSTKLTEFAKQLRAWRGNRGQKEVAELVGANLRTYEGWENGRNPSRYAINQIRRQMEQHPEIKKA